MRLIFSLSEFRCVMAGAPCRYKHANTFLEPRHRVFYGVNKWRT